MSQATILVVDDEPDIRQLVQEILEDEHYQVLVAENADQARKLKRQSTPDLILLDIWMPDTDGITLLKEWLSENETIGPVVMMSGHGTVETAVEATRLGAYDFLEKPLSLAKLLLTVEQALDSRQAQNDDNIPKRSAQPIVELIGKSATIEHLKDQVKRLAQHDTHVLFSGESGSGKKAFARYLHNHSTRRNGPFIEMAVGAIVPEHSAIELFGKEEGEKVFYGLLEQAHGGTLFLNEIGEMDAETQLRLLSVMESQSFLRVGGSEHVRIDVRIIASTPHSLQEDILEGRFRQDLYYLLNEVTLEIPPLREHTEDIPELLKYYIDYFVTREKLAFRRFPVSVQNFLRNYPWYGNIKELKNLVQRLLILGSGEEIELHEVKSSLGATADFSSTGELPEYYNLPLKEAREHFEKAYLEYHLEHSNGNVARLSSMIGIERTHLYRKLHALNIKFKDKK